jgi:HK97 family phage major capsid protein
MSSNTQSRAALIARANSLLNTKPFTQESSALFDRLMKLSEQLTDDSAVMVDETRAKEERTAFLQYFRGEKALRTYSAMSDAVEGAYIVPSDFYTKLLEGISQYTELMDANNVTLIETTDARSLGIPQIGLESITSAIVADNIQTSPVANPVFGKLALTGYTYKSSPIAVGMQVDMDSFQPVLDVLTRAFGVGIARGVGADLVNGSGSGAPMGVLTAAADSTVTAASSSVFTYDELKQVYFSCNRAYRVSPKAAWLMNDTIYQNLYLQKDSAGRPLISVTEDGEKIFGKKIIISPDMPTAANSRALCFGDFSQFIVRVPRNGVSVRRNEEAPGYAEKAQHLYTNFFRVDAALNAPDGVKPIVYAKLHA